MFQKPLQSMLLEFFQLSDTPKALVLSTGTHQKGLGARFVPVLGGGIVVSQTRPVSIVALAERSQEHWPKWLPRTWRIAYFKEDGNVKVCYISPAGDKCLEKAAVMPLGFAALAVLQ